MLYFYASVAVAAVVGLVVGAVGAIYLVVRAFRKGFRW